MCNDGFGRNIKQLSSRYKRPESDLNEHEMEAFLKDLEKLFKTDLNNSKNKRTKNN